MRAHTMRPGTPAFVALAGLLFTACVGAPVEDSAGLFGEEEPTAESAERLSFPGRATLPLTIPSFSATPNIAASAAAQLSPNARVRTILTTESGLQIYQCALNTAQVPAWTLRSPLAHVPPEYGPSASALQSPLYNTSRLLVGTYHYRSDFGAQLSQVEISTLGLANPPTNAPVWDVSYRLSTGQGLREVVAGRLLAQDTVGAGNIPAFFIEVRGRLAASSNVAGGVSTPSAVDPYRHPIAASEYILRWNVIGGMARRPCTSSNLGAEERAPYFANYYFIDNNPPAGI